MKKVFLLMLVLYLCLGLMAGCGGGTTPPDGGVNTPSPTTTPTVSGERPCRITMAGNPYADPHIFQNLAVVYQIPNFYDSLVTYDLEGNMISYICESWENVDELTYIFKLKPGVKFHDGSEMKASDVVFSWLRQCTIDAGFSYMYKAAIKEAVALDDYTVQFNLNHPAGPFVETMARLYIVNEDVVMANLNFNSDYNYGKTYGDFGRTYMTEKDAGSGPYMVREVSQGNYVIADQFKDYIIPFPVNAPTWIQFINNIEAATVRTMISGGELECTDPWQSAENINAMDALPGVDIALYSNLAHQNVSFNCSRFPGNDENFRKAVAYAIDYEAIVNSLFPGSKLAIGPVSEGFPGYDNAVTKNPYHYNPELAKEYLAKSKYNGEAYELFAGAGNVTQEKIIMAVQTYCAAIGINCTVTSAPYSTQMDLSASPETAPVTTLGLAPYYLEPGCPFETLFSITSAGSTANPTWIQDKDFNDKVAKALQISDQKERFEAYREIEQMILDRCYSIFLSQTTLRVCYRSDYVDFPAVKYHNDTGNLSTTMAGTQFWLHDWGINK